VGCGGTQLAAATEGSSHEDVARTAKKHGKNMWKIWKSMEHPGVCEGKGRILDEELKKTLEVVRLCSEI